jgi:hypothetical protein
MRRILRGRWSKPGERKATDRKKIAGSRHGKQFVANTPAAARARKRATRHEGYYALFGQPDQPLRHPANPGVHGESLRKRQAFEVKHRNAESIPAVYVGPSSEPPVEPAQLKRLKARPMDEPLTFP